MDARKFQEEVGIGLKTDLNDYVVIAHRWVLLACARGGLGMPPAAAPRSFDGLRAWGSRVRGWSTDPVIAEAARRLEHLANEEISWKETYNDLLDVAGILARPQDDVVDDAWAQALLDAMTITYPTGPVSPLYHSRAYTWLAARRDLGLSFYEAAHQPELDRRYFPYVLHQDWNKAHRYELVGLARQSQGVLAAWYPTGSDPMRAPIVCVDRGGWRSVAADLETFVEWAVAEAPEAVREEARTTFGIGDRDRETIEAEARSTVDFEAWMLDVIASIRGLSARSVQVVDEDLVDRANEMTRRGNETLALRMLMHRVRQGRLDRVNGIARRAANLAIRLGRGEDAVTAACAAGPEDVDLLVRGHLLAGQLDEARALVPRLTTDRRLAATVHDALGDPVAAREQRILADETDPKLQETMTAVRNLAPEDQAPRLRAWREKVDAEAHPGLILAIDALLAQLEGGVDVEALRTELAAAEAAEDEERAAIAHANLGFALVEAGDEAGYDHLEHAALNLSYTSALGKRAIAVLTEAGRA